MQIDKNLIRGFARSMEKQALNIDPALVGALIGGGLGGTAGYHLTEDPRKRVRNMLLAGAAGALGGSLVGKRLFKRPPQPRPDDAMARVVREYMSEPQVQGEILRRLQPAEQPFWLSH